MDAAPRGRPGGIRRLVGFLKEHGEAVDADLQRFYGLGLVDVAAGRLSWRRLRGLLRHLPAGSATGQRLNPSEVWSVEAHLLASVVDGLLTVAWLNSDGRGARPRPLRRPGQDEGTRYGATTLAPRDAARLLVALAPKKEGVTDGC